MKIARLFKSFGKIGGDFQAVVQAKKDLPVAGQKEVEVLLNKKYPRLLNVYFLSMVALALFVLGIMILVKVTLGYTLLKYFAAVLLVIGFIHLLGVMIILRRMSTQCLEVIRKYQIS